MPTEPNVHSSVQLESAVLKSDRKKAGFTQSAFSAACRSVSLSTVRRAEQGYRVTESAARKMAQILNRPLDHYIAPPDAIAKADYVAWLAGDWTWVNISNQQNTEPALTCARMTIRQSGDQIEGEVVSDLEADQTLLGSFTGEVANDVVRGVIFSTDAPVPTRDGQFYCLTKRGNSWLEGVFSWHDKPGNKVESTRTIAVRRSSPDFTRHLAEAKDIVARELLLFRVRVLLEAGYPLEDAVKMLAALNPENVT